MDMNFQTILSSFKNQSTGTGAFKNLKNENQFLSIVENQDQKKYIEYVQNIDVIFPKNRTV